MTVYEKPELDRTEVERLLGSFHGVQPEDLTSLSGGNLSSVYAYRAGNQAYVIHFSDLQGAFRTERYVSNMLASQGVPYPRVYGQGQIGSLSYCISERITGQLWADLPADRQNALLPDLVDVIARMNQVRLGASEGFGWIQADGNGAYSSWEQFIGSLYGEDQTGTFWEGWTDLFRTTFLEKDVFEECRARLTEYSKFNSPHRHFVHGDCHAWNILSDGRTITGIIDHNAIYGDFLIDISVASWTVPGRDVVQAFREHYEKAGIDIPHFRERLLGAHYFKGLDGLRFYAKMDRRHDYEHQRAFLFSLI